MSISVEHALHISGYLDILARLSHLATLYHVSGRTDSETELVLSIDIRRATVRWILPPINENSRRILWFNNRLIQLRPIIKIPGWLQYITYIGVEHGRKLTANLQPCKLTLVIRRPASSLVRWAAAILLQMTADSQLIKKLRQCRLNLASFDVSMEDDLTRDVPERFTIA